MEREIIKEYSNGELTVVWKPKACIHAAECVKALPQVYDPEKKPWITAENATTEELKTQINKCPSGALTYKMNHAEAEEEQTAAETKADVIKDGPLLVHGTITVNGIDGSSETKNKITAFCRCGHSNNKPYCDGAHQKSGFQG